MTRFAQLAQQPDQVKLEILILSYNRDVLQYIVAMQIINLCRSYSGLQDVIEVQIVHAVHIQTYQCQHAPNLYFVLI